MFAIFTKNGKKKLAIKINGGEKTEYPFILIPKDQIERNDFERIVYPGAKEKNPEKLAKIETLMSSERKEWAELLSNPTLKRIKIQEEQQYTELERKIKEDVAKLGLEKIKSLEERIDSIFLIFKKHFVEAQLYPKCCDWAAHIVKEIAIEFLGYEARIMRSKYCYHFFIEIKDGAGRIWILDFVAEQFKEPFGEQYYSSCYETKINTKTGPTC